MSIRSGLMICATTLMVAAAPAFAAAEHAVKSPADVKAALGTLYRVVDHTQRLITEKNYSQLPHENDEFKVGSEALEKAVAVEPASFKQQIDPLLKKANTASNEIAVAAKDRDDAKLKSSHAELASSVSALLTAFPHDVQPPPPSIAQEKANERARQ